eukprot:CAMPEP_0117609464 /NCGR_PEP_ID=MMETSP0784-20121206/81350_1 /TAXON_ID=39447 /ORGANISM="" /LENGTH=49 /DNA_ID= /DNA_START= /DNA_END= /DNA_ORIENTATION=
MRFDRAKVPERFRRALFTLLATSWKATANSSQASQVALTNSTSTAAAGS